MLDSGRGGYSSNMRPRGRVLDSGHGGYRSDMRARGRLCFIVVMVDTAQTCVRVDACAEPWS